MIHVGLDSPERHLARVALRMASGGHDIPERTTVLHETPEWAMPIVQVSLELAKR